MFRSLLIWIRRLRYPGSLVYWKRRYAKGGHSGSGSGKVLAAYKAQVLNRFVLENRIKSVIELGCGDGRQLLLADYPQYTGLDIAPAAITRCRALFAGDPAKSFQLYVPDQTGAGDLKAELGLSLEVIFHLTEQDIYEKYLRDLFASATLFVLIFSSDEADNTSGIFPHFKPRHFTADLPRLAPGWTLIERIGNPHRDISVSDFFVFRRV